MDYAPIIIPTLNRVDHLKRCLKSLEMNIGAEQTEVYISVDYPPAQKYWDGYLEVKKWLNDNANAMKFKKVHVFFQDINLGARENSFFLEDQIKEKSDRYIYTEDDNEFSPNFLQYINLGLDIFENDEKILGICGAKDTEWIYDDNNIAYVKLFPAYGYGSWFSKEYRIKKRGQEFLLDKETLNPKFMRKLFVRNRCLFNTYICNVLCKEDGLYWNEDELYWCDSLRSIYMHLSDVVCVAPQKVKSRTWGNDGSGINMAALDINPEEEWPLDADTSFVYSNVQKLKFNEDNYNLGNQYLRPMASVKGTIKAIMLYGMLLLCKRDRKKVINVIQKNGF